MNYDDFCIICLENITRKDAIWNCTTCYAEYHISCINDWIQQHKASKNRLLIEEESNMNLSDGHGNALTRLNKLREELNQWSCPKCRVYYTKEDTPSKYYCYCGKSRDPETSDWSAPHTCGQQCGRPLRPLCGDVCMELCHRGPCAPCPRMLREAPCFCGRSCHKAVRCSQRFWSCGDPCGKLLGCSQHSCGRACHQDACGPCQEKTTQSCRCGNASKEVACGEEWQCSKTCRSVDTAAQGLCGCGRKDQTRLGGARTCSETCGKFLECGRHRCLDKCHLGDCGLCRQSVSKRCKCGLSTSLVACYKDFSCTSKCERMRSCGRHRCKRRCCDPESTCQLCEVMCNSTLNCRRHKCPMPCHTGPCYPCQKMVEVTCACGTQKRMVACGTKSERIEQLLTKSCTNNCPSRSKCRHPNVHRCHSGYVECPTCREQCGATLSECGHSCASNCHDAVKQRIRLDKTKLAGPWEAKDDGKMVFVKMDCPPCETPLSIVCMGAHEAVEYPCWRRLTSISCGRPCGRLHSCGKHHCETECHPIDPDCLVPNDVISESPAVSPACPGEPCQRLCEEPRPAHCTHPCPGLHCHPGPCPPCTRYLTYSCHCGALANLHLPCSLGPTPPPLRLCCPARCLHHLSDCGHQCPRNCHPGICADQPTVPCKTKVALFCPCGRNKISMPCWKTRQDPTNPLLTVKCAPDTKCRKLENPQKKFTGSPSTSVVVKSESKVSFKVIVLVSVLVAMVAIIVAVFIIPAI